MSSLLVLKCKSCTNAKPTDGTPPTAAPPSYGRGLTGTGTRAITRTVFGTSIAATVGERARKR
jgi:hypothetical protein